MSYDRMDHAGWVADQIAAVKRRPPNAAEARFAAEGLGWHAAPARLNEFHRRAFTLLGIVGGGIYNAAIVWPQVYWGHPFILGVPWRGRLSTFDFRGLTDAVLLAHDARIRLEIRAKRPCLELLLANRSERAEGDPINVGHPSLEQAVAAHRARFPLDHPIHYAPRAHERLMP